MAEEPKKPRKVKDLKARLGRTIAPNTARAGGDGADIAPPPNLGGGDVVPPPSSLKGLGDVLGKVKPKVEAPPMVQEQQRKAAEEEERRKKQAANPFAAGEADGPQQVRIVLDGDPVDDKEVGRKNAGKIAVLGTVFAIVGAIIGITVTGVRESSAKREAVIADARSILESAQAASEGVQQAQQLVDRAINKANPQRTGGAEVDYAAIEGLRAIPRPEYNVNTFAGTHFNEFTAAAQPIIQYHMLLEQLFNQIEHTATHTLSARNRATLDEAAQELNGIANSTFSRPTSGCIPTITSGQLVCNLVWVDWPTTEPTEPLTELPTRVTRRSQRVNKKIYTGQSLTSEPEQYVIITNGATSREVLGVNAGQAFQEYRTSLAKLRELVNQTIEVQGQLETALGQIVSHDG